MGISIVPTLKVLKPVGLILGGGFAGLLLGYWFNVTYFPGDTPKQPIDFSHRIHATEFEIPWREIAVPTPLPETETLA